MDENPPNHSNNLKFRQELETLINQFSMENRSDTPDFILAEYLCDCLEIFDRHVNTRTEWYITKPNDNGIKGEMI